MPERASRQLWPRVGDVLLTAAAVLGTLCIALVIAAAVFDVRIILFSTGSMSPTIPAGSVALVRSIPAAEVHVDDVVTVDRPGQLPITHRVQTIEQIEGASEMRRITMRGDANAVDDPFPYEVSQVRLVLFSVPDAAPVVAAMGNPWILGTLTLGAATLVIGVFWPRRARERLAHFPPDPGASADAESDAHPDPYAGALSPPGPAPSTRRAARAAARSVAPFGLIILTIALTAVPSEARAAASEQVIEGAVIRLVSIGDPGMQGMTPGSAAVWQVGVTADASTPGTIDVSVSATGNSVLELRYEVEVCPQRWVDDRCPSQQTVLPEQTVPTDGVERPLLEMADRDAAWLRISVAMPAGVSPDTSGAVQMRVLATGYGEDVAAASDGSLAATGGGSIWPLLVAAILLMSAGASVLVFGPRSP